MKRTSGTVGTKVGTGIGTNQTDVGGSFKQQVHIMFCIAELPYGGVYAAAPPTPFPRVMRRGPLQGDG